MSWNTNHCRCFVKTRIKGFLDVHPTYPILPILHGKPQKTFKHLKYIGQIARKKLSSKSQYVPKFDYVEVNDTIKHSQMGESYVLANLGNLDELYERLGKYDVEHPPLNKEVALLAIKKFLDPIGELSFMSKSDAFHDMDMSKAIGFGAKLAGVFSREDPKMYSYLKEYVNKSKVQKQHVLITASQKDEIRVVGKTPRLFMSFPPEHTFLATIVLGQFQQEFIDNRFCASGMPSAVGDSLQKGACAMYKFALKKRKYPYCTDTSAQDSSVPAEFLHMFYDELKRHYDLDEEENMMFESVRHNSIYKYVNMNGDVYLSLIHI